MAAMRFGFALGRLRKLLPEIGYSPREAGSFIWFAMRRFNDDNGFGVASSLTYTTLLGIVPIMAIFLGVLGAFPVFAELRDRVKELLLEPLVPEASIQVRGQLDVFLSNAQQLTLAGLVGLALTSFLLLWTIEAAFSTIWRVVEGRSWSTRLLAFWTILTASPLIVASSVSLSNYFERKATESGFGHITHVLDHMPIVIPLVTEIIAFALLFKVIPHRHVWWRHALVGGFVAGTLFEGLKHGFGFYLGYAETYRILYGALATVPIFLLWIYTSWCVILFGAQVAASVPDWRADREARKRGKPRPGERLAMAIAVLRELWLSCCDGDRPHREQLDRSLPGGSELYSQVLLRLVATGYIAVTEDERLVIARDLDDVTLYDLAADMGLNLGTDLGPDFAALARGEAGASQLWPRRLAEVMNEVDRVKRDRMAKSVKSFIARPPQLEQIRAAE